MAGEGRAPVPAVVGAVARPLYAAEIARRNRAYDRGRGVTRLDRAVVSVGNLSVGGTGKTPTVRTILRVLLDAGHRPCVAMRGYKSTRRRESDEAAAHRRALPGVPVVAQPDRVAGLRALFETEVGRRVDCVVLDDGFQHRRIARDLDVVLIDATRSPFADRLLPAGWLREPPSSLARADVVVLTHTDRAGEGAAEGLRRSVLGVAPGALVATARHAWTGLVVSEEGAERVEPVSWLGGKRVVAACAIGNPEGFLARLEGAAGAAPVARVVRRDHDPYAPATVEQIVAAARDGGADVVVTTEKDWSKLGEVSEERWPCPVVRPVLEVQFEQGGEAVRAAVLGAVSGRAGDGGAGTGR